MPPDKDDKPRAAAKRFLTTHWSLVLAASKSDATAVTALATLCELYWYPVYAFIRRQGHSADEATDLTQEFFARVLEKSFLRDVSPERGRFRSFLLACLRNFLANERDRTHALKRGGHLTIRPLAIDDAEGRYRNEPRDDLTPEKIFERRWALTVLNRTMIQLKAEHVSSGKRDAFDALKGFLTGSSEGVPYNRVARTLRTTEGAARVAVHRFRRRFRDLLIAQVSATVGDPRDVDDEIKHLLRSVTR